MAVENATTPDELDASLPLGTDFKNEGDNHIRLIKAVIKNVLQGITGRATQAQAQNIASPVNTVLSTPLRVYEMIQANIATQTIAEGGADNTRTLTSLRVKQYVDKRLATTAEAEGLTDNTALMTSLRVKEQLDFRRASQAQAEGLADNTTFLTPLRGNQTAQKVWDNNFTSKKASQAQSDAGTNDATLVTPLKARVTGDGRYLRLAQTTAFSRALLTTTSNTEAQTALGFSAHVNYAISDAINEANSTQVASSAAVKAVNDKFPVSIAGTDFLMLKIAEGDIQGAQLNIGYITCFSAGTVTMYFQQKRSAGATNRTAIAQVRKNGVSVQQWNTTSESYVTRQVNVDVVPGDVIHLYITDDADFSTCIVRRWRLYSGNQVLGMMRGGVV